MKLPIQAASVLRQAGLQRSSESSETGVRMAGAKALCYAPAGGCAFEYACNDGYTCCPNGMTCCISQADCPVGR